MRKLLLLCCLLAFVVGCSQAPSNEPGADGTTTAAVTGAVTPKGYQA